MICPRCGLELSDAGITTVQPIACPSCGKIIAAPAPSESVMAILKNYFHDLRQIMSHPKAFFQKMPLSGGLTRPLCFALITHWLGSVIGFIWQLLIGGMVLNYLRELAWFTEGDYGAQSVPLARARDQIFHWFFGMGSIIIDPFLTLFSIFFTSLIVYFGARILITPQAGTHEPQEMASEGIQPEEMRSGEIKPKEIKYETIVRIICFGMSPAILVALPLVGGVVSSFCVMIVTIIGIKEVFKIGTGRAIVVFLFPKLLFMGIIGLGLLAVATFILQFFVSAFH